MAITKEEAFIIIEHAGAVILSTMAMVAKNSKVEKEQKIFKTGREEICEALGKINDGFDCDTDITITIG